MTTQKLQHSIVSIIKNDKSLSNELKEKLLNEIQKMGLEELLVFLKNISTSKNQEEIDKDIKSLTEYQVNIHKHFIKTKNKASDKILHHKIATQTKKDNEEIDRLRNDLKNS